MGKSSGPRPPDPYRTAQAQTQANRAAIQDSILANRYNISSPYGSVTWSRPEPSIPSPSSLPSSGSAPSLPDFGGGVFGRMISRVAGQAIKNGGGMPGANMSPGDLSGWTQNVSLSPEMQRQFDLGNERSIALGDLALDRISNLDRNFSMRDYAASSQPLEQATFDRAMQLMQPQLEQRDRQMENRLAVQGIPQGGEAYNAERDRFDRMRNEMELAAALESVGAGRQEQSRQFGMDTAARQQEMSELASILGGIGGIQGPQVPQTAQYQAAPPDISGLISNNYNTQANQQAAKKGGTSNLIGTLGGAALIASDRRLKRNISRVGQYKDYNLYQYQYTHDDAWQIGVMADEVEKINPSAVLTLSNGYKAVNYGAL